MLLDFTLVYRSGNWQLRSIVALTCTWAITAATGADLKDQPHVRRPVAAAWIEPGKLLAVANSRSGSVSIVDIPGRKVLEEIAVGEKLADIAAMPTGGRLLAVDELRHELIALDLDGKSLRVTSRTSVSPFPVSVGISTNGSRISVASLWSRKLMILEPNIDLPAAAGHFRPLAAIDLPFNPRRQLVLPGDKQVVIADAFAGGMVVVDHSSCEVVPVPTAAFVSIQSLTLSFSSDRVVIGHQMRLKIPQGYIIPHEVGRTYVSSGTSTWPISELTESKRTSGTGRLFSVHRDDLAAAVAAVSATRIALANPSRDRVEVFGDGVVTTGVAVGRGPTALVRSGFWEPLVAVNRWGDSLTLIDHQKAKFVGEIFLGPKPSRQPAERGEELFYDGRLARNGWQSCHSCHTDGHTSGQLADTLGDGTEGAPKRIPTLLGSRLTDPWAWNGQVRNLNDQVRKSLETTMHARNITPQQVDDITAFLHTLPPPPPLQPATDEPADKAQLARGQALFASLGCAKCHVPPLTYTSPEAYDVGLADEKGQRKFNPPSLRGVSQGYAFFHDGRAKQLEDVFTVHGHQLERPLEKAELADLLRFLRSL